MGAGPSISKEQLERLEERGEFNANQLKKLHAGFVRRDMGEVVVVSDLYRIPEVKQQPLLSLAIQSVTPDDTGKTIVDSGDQPAEDVGPTIPFEEFASVMYTLSSSCPAARKTRFLFDIFDRDKSGFIEKPELVEIMSLLVGTHIEAPQIEEIVERIASHCDLVEIDGVAREQIFFPYFQTLVEEPSLLARLTLDLPT